MNTLQNVWDKALLLYGLPADDGYLSPIEVRRTIVSVAQRDVASEIDWPELEVEGTLTIAGDPPFALPAAENFMRIAWVYIDGNEDVMVSKQRRELLPYETEGFGATQYFAANADGLGQLQLWLAPKPRLGTVIRYAYIRKPDDLSNPTDQLLIPDHLIEAVIHRVMYYVAMLKGDLDRATVLSGQFERTLDKLRDEAVIKKGPSLPRTRKDW